MDAYESFGQCLQRLLNEDGISASAAARLVGFRSRNSLFRILSGETSVEVDARFLAALRRVMGEKWSESRWIELETALDVKRMGLRQYTDNRAFCQGMYGGGPERSYMVECLTPEGLTERPLGEMLQEVCREGQITVVISGCCERGLTGLLAASFSDAAQSGRLTVRHYIDSGSDVMVPHLLSALPLMSKVWYNARLVDEAHCPAEMAAVYRVNIICLAVQITDGPRRIYQLVQCDHDRFVEAWGESVQSQLISVLDRHRFQLGLLKPMADASSGPEAFVRYTQQYAQLESDCMILSIKPDVHFNLVPTSLLYQAILEGFGQAGMASGNELNELLASLQEIHDGRIANMYGKRRPTHIVYSLQAMEQFMRTGVQSDHFFIQRAYTVEERRSIIRQLLTQMKQDPYFNICFLRPELPELRTEMTFYEGKGVLLMDAYTSYDLHDDHSEALITLPEFQNSFQKFFFDVLLERMVLSRQESMAQLERLLQL